jgi:menaquinone-dependent protoporphyrinogen oxidase
MRVLAVAASKHGSTAGIATALGEALAHRGITAVVAVAGDVVDLGEYDAVVLGSAVYVGRWLMPARDLAERHGAFLASRPVWLSSSGPVGDPLQPAEDSPDVAPIFSALGAQGHRAFAGKIDKSRLGLAERAMVRALKVSEGDYRAFGDVAAWAGEIADILLAQAGR